VTGEASADEILHLPGWDDVLPSRHFSGYLDIGVSKQKHLHYWLVESEVDPASAPVVVWMNGGPGCSSLDGFIYEHGPFRVNTSDPKRLQRFDYTWSKLANVIYLEAPVGVGFSYSDDRRDYERNDDNTAEDNVDALNAFFEKWPEWRGNGLYITGESYGGVYVPTLAEGILWAAGNGTWTGAKLLGIAVGNGCTGTEIGSCGRQSERFETEYLLGTAFISSELKSQIRKECNWDDYEAGVNQESCNSLLREMHETVGNINQYDVYGECIDGSEQHRYGALHSKAPRAKEPTVKGPNACIDSILGSKYLNLPEVIEAMHVKKQSFEWSVCGNQMSSYRSTRPNLPRDTYPFLIENIQVTIYNGDWDVCVPYTDNEAWTEGMGYDVESPWHPWTYKGGQVAGYATSYENGFTFVTVKGGRHEVPETAPEAALELFRRVITGTGFADGKTLV